MSVPAGGTETVTFEHAFDEQGDRSVAVAGGEVGVVSVASDSQDGSDDGTDDGGDASGGGDGGAGGGGGGAPIAIGVLLLVGVGTVGAYYWYGDELAGQIERLR